MSLPRRQVRPATAPMPSRFPPRRLAPDTMGAWVYAFVIVLLLLQVVALVTLDIL